MNKIEQAYEQGLRIRTKEWNDSFWIKKYSNTQAIDEIGRIINFDKVFYIFERHVYWEIWHEDLPLLKDQADIKAQIQTHLNQIQELLKQL